MARADLSRELRSAKWILGDWFFPHELYPLMSRLTVFAIKWRTK